MATALSTPLTDPGGCLICQRLALAVVLVDLGNTSKEISRCFSITARFAGSHRSLQPNTVRLPVQSVPVTIRQRLAWVPLDASFAEATNAAITYHVFLTPNGDSNGLYVARKTSAGFEVREHGGGGSNVAFDYRIVVRRRGYETVRMAEVHGDVKTVESSRQHLIELTNSGTLTKRGVVEVPRNAAAPAIRPVAPRTVVPAQAIQPVPQIPKMNVPQPLKPR